MKNSYYVLFYSPASQTITIPIKALGNPHDPKRPAFAAGAPQFFGGNSEGYPLDDTLKNEVSQETRRTYELTGYSPAILHSGHDRRGNYYEFHVSYGNFRQINPGWPSTTDLKELEMDRLVTVDLRAFTGVAPSALLDRLISVSGSTPTPQGLRDLRGSETARAFVRFIQNWQAGHP